MRNALGGRRSPEPMECIRKNDFEQRRQRTGGMARALSILACMFQGGGNVPLILPILTELIARGHIVRVMAGPGVRRSRLKLGPSLLRRVEEMGAAVVPFREPHIHPFNGAAFTDRGLIGSWTPRSFRGVQHEARTTVWAPAWALNVSSELRREKVDLVVADFVLLGALVAAEAARIPHIAVMHTVYPWPTPGVPPYGPGYAPKAGLLGLVRDAIARAAIERLWVRNALPSLNHARSQTALPALHSPLQQYDTAARVLVLASAAFDWPASHLPANVRHVGTPEDGAKAAQEGHDWLTDGKGPFIVVSLSTLDQGQTATLKNILAALSGLPIRALITLGPALESQQFEAPSNVRLEKFVRHDLVLPRAVALVTQCGIGTLTKALRHGVPMVCLPLVGDQHDNAARVVARNAGVRFAADASPDQLRSAIWRAMTDQRLRQGALDLGAAMALEGNAVAKAADEIEFALRLDDDHTEGASASSY
jgi:UDP:flavonoid glycosyltransferase YjiC (YdhE family)